MLYNHSNGMYGQIGWIKLANGNRYNFTESDTNLGPVQRFFTASGENSSPEYKITFSSDAFHYFLNGTNYYTDGPGTGYGGCWAQQASEVTNTANQLPGSSGAHENFTNGQVRRNDTGWVDTNGTEVNNKPSWWGWSKISSTQLDVWDKAC
jgi:hypothetical protein